MDENVSQVGFTDKSSKLVMWLAFMKRGGTKTSQFAWRKELRVEIKKKVTNHNSEGKRITDYQGWLAKLIQKNFNLISMC